MVRTNRDLLTVAMKYMNRIKGPSARLNRTWADEFQLYRFDIRYRLRASGTISSTERLVASPAVDTRYHAVQAHPGPNSLPSVRVKSSVQGSTR